MAGSCERMLLSRDEIDALEVSIEMVMDKADKSDTWSFGDLPYPSVTLDVWQS